MTHVERVQATFLIYVFYTAATNTYCAISIKQLCTFQFILPHTRGSSHGQTRIIRKAYDQDFYVPMMQESYELWSQLEREAGVKLYR